MAKIRSYKDLMVYQMAMDAAMRIFQLTKEFPREERYSLVDQIRRSSRSICTNIAEAWRRRRYKAAFVSKLNDAESEAEETRVWIEFCLTCEYLDTSTVKDFDDTYDHTIGKLVCMIKDPDSRVLR
jgi:four helix bundle protein